MPFKQQYVPTWRAMIELQRQGRIRSIGVSNFPEAELETLIEQTGVTPVIHQIELHPYLTQERLRAQNARHGIVTESWSPLANGGELLRRPVLGEIAARHGRTPAQVVLRWHVQQGLVTFPKASSRGRLEENLDVYGFELTDEDMAGIATLADGTRVNGQHPAVWEEF